MNISLVVPVYNEESVVEEFIRRTYAALSSFQDYELIFIDDGSTDSTYDLILKAASDNQKIKCIKFSRNFGHQHAVLAGLTKSQYEIIAVLDADLQDPPELLREMANKVSEGYEIVYGQRISRKGETFFKKMSAQTFYRILDLLTPIAIPKDTGDFRVISKKASKMVVEMKEVDPFLRGLFAFTGLKSFAFSYVREERFAGSTKYTLKKMVKLATDAIFGFSSVPLKIFMRVSQFLLITAIVFAIYAISRSIESGSSGGWLSIFSAVFFFGALNLSFLALIARYLMATLNAVQNRPSYVVEKYLNF